METETRQCQMCKKSFILEPNDLGFYEKIKVPPPTFCPVCRRQRRWASKNNMVLYNCKCDMCDRSIVSLYNPDLKLTVYCNKCWWGDKWDSKSFAQEYDFSRPFFEQYKELVEKVPRISVVNDDGIASVNCEYTNDWWFSKNCYMCFVGWQVQNSMYSFFLLAGSDMMDCLMIRAKCEWLYECMTCSLCYNLKYSQYCQACIDSQFLYDCRDCKDCFMCIGLRGKKFFFKNKQYTKEEYERILNDYKLDTFQGVGKAKKEFHEFISGFPRRYAQVFHNTNCTGDIVSYSKNSKNCFVVKNAENVQYSDFVGDTSAVSKDSYDLTTCGGLSECYEGVVTDHSQKNLFGLFSVKSQEITYTEHCHNTKYSFGCVGLRNSKYCILNKQYTKEEYEELIPKIKQHMSDMPYVDKKGRVYKYGEFFPLEISPFGYNETMAVEQKKLSKEEALELGFNWQDNVQKTTGKETLEMSSLPDSINEVTETILDEVLICLQCTRNFKIIQNEFIFYKKMKIPIPRKCFYCRHEARVNLRNPLKLWHRRCMCEKTDHDHEGLCPNEFETSYPPDRSGSPVGLTPREIVYCETCYQKEIY